jgi:hypothetical protein
VAAVRAGEVDERLIDDKVLRLLRLARHTGRLDTPTPDYWRLAQASKFVQPGARRVASNTLGKGSVEDVAFTNPDGSTALVTFNSGTTERTFTVGWGDRHFTYTLAAKAAATFTWTGDQSGSTDPAAIGSVDIPFRNPDGSRALITYDSKLLTQQAQVRIGDEWLGYTLPTGASLTPPTSEAALPHESFSVFQGRVALRSRFSPRAPQHAPYSPDSPQGRHRVAGGAGTGRRTRGGRLVACACV